MRASVRNELKAIACAKAITVGTVMLMWARNHRFFYRDDVEHQMIEHDRSLIAELVKRMGSGPRVRNVLLLDRAGAAAGGTGRSTTAPGADS